MFGILLRNCQLYHRSDGRSGRPQLLRGPGRRGGQHIVVLAPGRRRDRVEVQRHALAGADRAHGARLDDDVGARADRLHVAVGPDLARSIEHEERFLAFLVMAPRAGFARFQMKQRDADLVAAGAGGRGPAAQFAQGDAGRGRDDRQAGGIDDGRRRLRRGEGGQGGEQQGKWLHKYRGKGSAATVADGGSIKKASFRRSGLFHAARLGGNY